MRLFASVTPPAEVLDHLGTALSMLGDLPPAPVRDPRRRRPARAAMRSPWTPRETWHLTLAFFGSVPDGAVPDLESLMAGATGDLAPFRVHLTGAGTFRDSVLWVGVGGETGPLGAAIDALAPVHEEISGRQDPRERNRAHLTVSRSTTTDLAAAAHALAVYQGPSWTVDEIELVASDLGAGPQGSPVHTPVARFPLGGR